MSAEPGKKQIPFAEVPLDVATKYAAEDADITLRLWKLFKPQLVTEKVTTVYETLERPLVPVIAQIEREGIRGGPRSSLAALLGFCAVYGAARSRSL